MVWSHRKEFFADLESVSESDVNYFAMMTEPCPWRITKLGGKRRFSTITDLGAGRAHVTMLPKLSRVP